MRQVQVGGAWRAVAVGTLMLTAASAHSAESAWVKTGVTGRLIQVPDAEGDRVPDFSMVGYAAGKQAIPSDLPVLIRVDPIAGDNTQHVQNAINFAASRPLQASGFRGVVELGPGKFDVQGRLSIDASGVVLRGSGAGDDVSTSTHIVSQNRTDSLSSSASTPVISVQGSSSGTTRGPEIAILDKVVPVGAKRLSVASTAGFSVGGMVEVFRPSTQAWIEELGMDQIPGGEQWDAGDRDLQMRRTITRIEGNTLFLDAPITTALDTQWGGGTVRTFSAPGVIRNVGVENLRGQSLDLREESNEDRTPTFVRFSRAEDGWVRDVQTRHFPYASVYTLESDGTQRITVDNVASTLPAGQVTGGRRYTFAMDAPLSLVTNSRADAGRHDFVTGSDVTGPIVFHNSTTSNTRGDAGPHHRWGNGLLLDNIDVNGNAINVQNRWDSGSGHGWSGANVVVWNSKADSFIVQSPPTAQSWLVGSTGEIRSGNCHLGGASCAGYYDSHGERVTAGGVESLYEAQLNDAADLREFHWTGGHGDWDDPLAWDQAATPEIYQVETRDYVLGDFDRFRFDGRRGADVPYVDPSWQAAVENVSAVPLTGFDTTLGPQNVAFTVRREAAAGERVIHGSLAVSLRASGATGGEEFVQLFDAAAEQRLSFASLGWDGKLDPSEPFVGVIDLGDRLDQLQQETANLWIGETAAVDWALYSVTVATPKADPDGAVVYLDNGGAVAIGPGAAPIGALQNGGGDAPSELTIAAAARLAIRHDYAQLGSGSLTVEIAGPSTGQFGAMDVGDQAFLTGELGVELVGAYQPSVGEQFEVLSAGGGVTGEFDAVIVADASGQGVWGVLYEPDSVSIELLFDTPFGDLDLNGVVDHLDWDQYAAWALADLTGLSLADAYTRGDLTGDGLNNLDDMRLFINAYDAANGSGAFSRMAYGAPEPAACLIALLGGASLTQTRVRRS